MSVRPPRIAGAGKQGRPRAAPAAQTDRRRPAVVIAGFGRLGGALAMGLREAGWPISVHADSEASRRAARRAGFALADAGALASARAVLIAVQDAAVGGRTSALCPALSPRCALVHLSGALTLEALGTSTEVLRHPRGSFHPLAAVSSRETSLAGRTVALSATAPALHGLLKRMAKDLGLAPIEIPEARRAAYHAAAVMSAGGAVALLASATDALKHAGLDEDAAVKALLPLMRSALDGVEARGLSGGLTGPIARGDEAVVQAHLDALPARVLGLYRALSLRMLPLSTLAAGGRRRLRRRLESPGDVSPGASRAPKR